MSDEKIIKMLEQIQGSSDSMQNQMITMQTQMIAMQNKLDVVYDQTGSMQKKLDVVFDQTAKLTEDVTSTIKEAVIRIEGKVESIHRWQIDTDNVVDVLAARTTRLEGKVNPH